MRKQDEKIHRWNGPMVVEYTEFLDQWTRSQKIKSTLYLPRKSWVGFFEMLIEAKWQGWEFALCCSFAPNCSYKRATVSDLLPLIFTKEWFALFSWAKCSFALSLFRSFNKKKQAIGSKNPWENSQPCKIVGLVNSLRVGWYWGVVHYGKRNNIVQYSTVEEASLSLFTVCIWKKLHEW